MWVIYAIMVDGKIDYIGMTKNLRQRTHGHKGNRYYDFWLEPVVLHRARTQAAAKKAERRLIRKHKPPRNVQHNARGAITLVETYRVNPSGKMIPVTFRLRDGMMHPDEARNVWFNPEFGMNAVALRHMPGWTLERALSTFGSRHPPDQKDADAGMPWPWCRGCRMQMSWLDTTGEWVCPTCQVRA